MTNREMIEYINMCNNEVNIDINKKEYSIFLDSDVSIRDVCVAYSNCGLDYYECFRECVTLFTKFKDDEDRRLALRILCMVISDYLRYFEFGDIEVLEDKIYNVLNSDGLNIRNLEHRLRIVEFGNRTGVEIKGLGDYDIRYYENIDGSTYFSLKNHQNKKKELLNIGAITFKNEEHSIYRLECKKDMKYISRIVGDLDYDICLCVGADKIINKLDKMVRG